MKAWMWRICFHGAYWMRKWIFKRSNVLSSFQEFKTGDNPQRAGGTLSGLKRPLLNHFRKKWKSSKNLWRKGLMCIATVVYILQCLTGSDIWKRVLRTSEVWKLKMRNSSSLEGFIVGIKRAHRQSLRRWPKCVWETKYCGWENWEFW